MISKDGTDWAYRQQTWTGWFSPAGPCYRASHPGDRDSVGPLTLPALLDRICTAGGVIRGDRWVEWKAAHPEVFGEQKG